MAPFGLVHSLSRQDCDLTQLTQIREIVRQLRPDIIVNASAYTAVDKAESEPQIAYLINATVPSVLAEEAASIGALLVHYSTDYVFDGTASTPYKEEDKISPVNIYGASKLRGEEMVLNNNSSSIIIRTSWVFSSFGNNFVKTMLRLLKEKENIK